MNKPIIAILLATIIISLIAGCTQQATNQTTNQISSTGVSTLPSANASSTSTTNTQPSGTPKLYSLEEVAPHNSESDCWMVISDKVYDVTKFVYRHPGGPAILQGCGKDATQMFESRPNDGTSHSGRARNMLAMYYIGDLKK